MTTKMSLTVNGVELTGTRSELLAFLSGKNLDNVKTPLTHYKEKRTGDYHKISEMPIAFVLNAFNRAVQRLMNASLANDEPFSVAGRNLPSEKAYKNLSLLVNFDAIKNSNPETEEDEEILGLLYRIEKEFSQKEEYYNSSTKGRVKISEMRTPHLTNAISKIVRENTISYYPPTGDGQSLITYLRTSNNYKHILELCPKVKPLLDELYRRYDK